MLLIGLFISLISFAASYKTCNNFKYELSIAVLPSSNASGRCLNYAQNEFKCHGLQAALETISEWQEDCSLFTAELAPTLHYITWPVNITASVHFTSNTTEGLLATVSCNFDAAKFTDETGELHMLYFNQSDSVMFSNVKVEGCPLPIRIDQVNIAKIEGSLFK